jgi:hypothetical protein
MAQKSQDKKAAISRRSKSDALRQAPSQGVAATAGRRSAGRITSVPLNQIVLDRFQPRPVLPSTDGLREEFFSGKSDWKKTASKWLKLAEEDYALEGQVQGLLAMGKSITELNQIEPASGAWVELSPGDFRMMLSTGERRFWSLALAAVVDKNDDPQLEVQEIQLDEMGIERQIVENESAMPLTAIGKARAIAGLILERLDDLPPELDRTSENPPTDHEYYSSVLDLEDLTGSKYMPRGMWEEIGELLEMDRSYMTRHLDLLKLPVEVQHIADSNNVTENVLREVLKLSPAQWDKAVRLVITEDLSANEIKKLKKGSMGASPKEITRAVKAGRRMKAFWKETKAISTDTEIGKIATEFAAGQDKEDLEKAIDKLEKFVNQLRLRVRGMD